MQRGVKRKLPAASRGKNYSEEKKRTLCMHGGDEKLANHQSPTVSVLGMGKETSLKNPRRVKKRGSKERGLYRLKDAGPQPRASHVTHQFFIRGGLEEIIGETPWEWAY